MSTYLSASFVPTRRSQLGRISIIDKEFQITDNKDHWLKVFGPCVGRECRGYKKVIEMLRRQPLLALAFGKINVYGIKTVLRLYNEQVSHFYCSCDEKVMNRNAYWNTVHMLRSRSVVGKVVPLLGSGGGRTLTRG